MNNKSKVILLWGYTQVGKTSLLATAFYHESSREILRPFIDFRRSAKSLDESLIGNWQRLKENQWVRPTKVDIDNIELVDSEGGKIIIRDGGAEKPIFVDRITLSHH